MKKIILLLLSAVLSITAALSQEYDEHDKAKLRAFLIQPSGIAGVTNGERLGLTASEVGSLNTNDTWVSKMSDVYWTEDTPKRITSIYWSYPDSRKNLSGGLDMSGCTALGYLGCAFNQLSSLDVSGCTALTDLECGTNELTSLDVTGCRALETLNCGVNRLTVLDISSCRLLAGLICSENQLTTLDVSGCTALSPLYCGNNQLTSLNVSGCSSLSYLICFDNQLTTLELTDNTALENLWCDRNRLTVLDPSNNTALTRLYCDGNQLAALDLSSNTLLNDFSCNNNQLTTLNLSNNTELTRLYVRNNPLTDVTVGWQIPMPYTDQYGYWALSLGNIFNATLHVPAGTKALYQSADEWKNFGLILEPGEVGTIPDPVGNYDSYDLGKLKAFLLQRSAHVDTMNGVQLGLTAAEMYSIETNTDWVVKISSQINTYMDDAEYIVWTSESPKRIAEINLRFQCEKLSGAMDFSGCESLTVLSCQGGRFMEVNVTGCTSLERLNCHDNYFMNRLLLGGCTSLRILSCASNEVSNFDVSGCPALEHVSCSLMKQVWRFDFSKNPKLKSLDCSGGREQAVVELNVSGCPELEDLNCFGRSYIPTLDLRNNLKLMFLMGGAYYDGVGGIDHIYVSWTEPPAFTILENPYLATLHVPVGTADLYRAAEPWRNFRTIIDDVEVASPPVSESQYHPHDLGKLKAFVIQPSGVEGQTNGERMGLPASVLGSLDDSDDWVSWLPFWAIKWTSESPYRIGEIYWPGLDDYMHTSGYQESRLSGHLDLSGCTALTVLSCQINELTSLDVSGCTALDAVSCSGNELSTLDAVGCESLTYLNCSSNQLTSLDVSSCTSLTTLYCYVNPLENLTVGFEVPLPAMEGNSQCLYLPDVSSATLHVPVGTAALYRVADGWKAFGNIVEIGSSSVRYASHDLSRLRSFLQQVPTRSVSSNGELLGLTSDDMSTWLTSDAWVEKVAGVTWDDSTPKRIISIDWHDRGLCGVLDVSGLSSLSSLNCSQNVITSLDISSLPALSELWCHGNPLSDITVSWQEPKSITSLGSGSSDWLLLHLPLVLSSTLHVPAGSAALYRAADGWGMFRTITESPYVATLEVSCPEVIVFVTVHTLTINSPSSEVITLYSTSGVILYQSPKDRGGMSIDLSRLPRGMILVSGSTGWTRKVIR